MTTKIARLRLATLPWIAALLVSGAASAAEPAPKPKTAPAAGLPTLAVLYFDYAGETEGLGLLRKGLAQMLISDLSGLSGVRIVERDRLQDIVEELELQKSAKIDKATAAKIGKLLGAKYLVLGGYFDLMGTLRLDVRVVETETGRVVRSFGAAGKPDDFMTLEQKIATDLEGLLTSQALEGFKAERTGAVSPARRPKRLTTATAARYGGALDAKDRGDKETAKKELEGVLAEAPDFTLAAADLDSLAQ